MISNVTAYTGEDFFTKLDSDLRIDVNDLNSAFLDQTAKFAFWATLAAQAKSEVEKKKLEVDQQDDFIKTTLIGELDTLVREEMTYEGEKITEAKVTSKIHSHQKFIDENIRLNELQRELSELKRQSNLLSVAKESFLQRKDMIISLGANLRQEVNNL